MTYTARPDLFFGLAMNADPNDPGATPVWTDYTTSLRRASALARGRQFELDLTMAADSEVVVRDVGEALNPDNTGSTHYGNILPMREALLMGTWPNPAAGNLMNANAWRVPFDPSFESYAAAATVPWITAVGGTAPVVGTTTPHAGSNDLTYTVVGTATVQGVQWTCYVMPGRQYTVSAYVRQSSASTQGIYAAGSVGTTTTSTGAYVRLTKTFTATAATVALAVLTSGTAVAGTVLVDDIQLEAGVSASAFTTTGSCVYPIMDNFLDSYRRTWASGGFEGNVALPCVDSLAALASVRIPTEYRAALAVTAPDYSWSLGDGSNATLFAGNNATTPSLVQFASKFGPGTPVSPGATMDVPGDPGATGVSFTASTGSAGTGQALSAIGYGHQVTNARDFAFPAAVGSAWSASIAAWVKVGTVNSANQIFAIPWYLNPNDGTVVAPISLGLAQSNKHAFAKYYNTATANTEADGTTAINDGLPHLLVGTITQTNGANTVIAIYVDGTLQTTTTVTTASLGGMLPFQADTFDVGGWFAATAAFCDNSSGASVSEVAMWNRSITAGEITTLWNAGGLGFAGETSGARVARHIALGGYVRATRISAGTTTMGPATYDQSIDLQTDTTNNAVAEGGMHWAAPDGAVVFEGRQDRWLRLTPSWTLGENVAGGEIPYETDIEYAYDSYFLYANVQVARNNGATFTGGSAADIATAARRFFGRSFGPQGSDFATDAQARDQASWIFYTHNRPASRIARIAVNPAANPALWPFALGVEIGQRIRVNRRPKAANGGAGITVTLDFFVENVTHDYIDMDTGEWSTIIIASPVGAAGSQSGLSMQPWIMDDTTYSVLDSTTICGW